MRGGGSRRALAVVLTAAVAVTAASCGRTGGMTEVGGEAVGSGPAPAAPTAADFAELKNVCQPGPGGGDTAQGVTGEEIRVGVMTDFGFTQNREFLDAADVFTSWCNDAGGINGRKLVANARDAKVFEYRQRILESCREDFFLVGGGAGLDGSGVKDRLRCLLPEIPGQTVSMENGGADLQVDPLGYNHRIGAQSSYFRWLVNEGFPQSIGAVGLIYGDVGIAKILAEQFGETLEGAGARVVYRDAYPATGVSDWTPYAQKIKSAGVKGLSFVGDVPQLAKLEQALSDVGYSVTWLDANSNAYNRQLIELAGANLDRQPTFANPAVFPLERAPENPPTQQLLDLFHKYKPDADVTKPVVNAWSAWLLFATSARDCGADVTRRCVYDKARSHDEWTGAGLHIPTELNDPDSGRICFNVERASSSGWTSADFAPNEGPYRCGDEPFRFKGDYGEAKTLADVGKSLDELK